MEKEELLFTRFRNFSLITGVITLSISFFVLIGWFFEIKFLRSVLPIFVTMKFNTALSLFFASLGLLILQETKIIQNWKRIFGALFGLFVFLMGSLTLYEIVFSVDLGIDQFFYAEERGALFTQHLGRMAPITATLFIFVGLAITLLALTARYKLIQLISFIAFIGATFSFLGYIFNLKFILENVYQARFTPIALHTSLSFIILLFGIFFSRPSHGYSLYITGDTIGASFVRRAFPFASMLIILSSVASLYGVRRGFYYDDVGFVFQVMINLSLIYVIGIIVAHKIYRIEAERKELLLGQIQEAARLDSLFESIGDAIISINAQQIITKWNSGAKKLTGWSEAEVIGQPFRKYIRFIEEYTQREDYKFIEDVLFSNTTSAVPSSFMLIVKNDRSVPISGSVSQVKNNKNEVAGVIMVLHDETRERSVNTIRSSFAYASHQIRTPVNKATWILEAMVESCKNKKNRRDILSALNALKSVHTLSEHIIAVSEVEQGMVLVNIEPVRIVDVLSHVKKTVKKQAETRSVKLIVSSFVKTTEVKTSAKLLKAALVEVVENAINFSQSNSTVKIIVRISGDLLVFEVIDMGIGIEEEQQPLVFTKFFRGSNFKTDEIPGSGLGLYLTNEYLKLLGGKIWFNSRPNSETIFYVAIPFNT